MAAERERIAPGLAGPLQERDEELGPAVGAGIPPAERADGVALPGGSALPPPEGVAVEAGEGVDVEGVFGLVVPGLFAGDEGGEEFGVSVCVEVGTSDEAVDLGGVVGASGVGGSRGACRWGRRGPGGEEEWIRPEVVERGTRTSEAPSESRSRTRGQSGAGRLRGYPGRANWLAGGETRVSAREREGDGDETGAGGGFDEEEGVGGVVAVEIGVLRGSQERGGEGVLPVEVA